MNTFNKLPPPSYFEKVKTKEDWHTLDCQGYMPQEWVSSFPSNFPSHRAMVKMYKKSLNKGAIK